MLQGRNIVNSSKTLFEMFTEAQVSKHEDYVITKVKFEEEITR